MEREDQHSIINQSNFIKVTCHYNTKTIQNMYDVMYVVTIVAEIHNRWESNYIYFMHC